MIGQEQGTEAEFRVIKEIWMFFLLILNRTFKIADLLCIDDLVFAN